MDENKQTLSSSSSLLNQFCPTSNCSSFTDEKRAPTPINNKFANIKTFQETNKFQFQNIPTTFDFHAKSVDFTNVPSKLNLTANGYPKVVNPSFYPPVTNSNKNIYTYPISKNNQPYYFPYNFSGEQINNYTQNYYENPNGINQRQIHNDLILIDNLPLYIRDQNGCRIIQKKIEEKNKEFLFKFYEKAILL